MDVENCENDALVTAGQAIVFNWLGTPGGSIIALPIRVPRPTPSDGDAGASRSCELTIGPLTRDIYEIRVSCSARTIEVLVASAGSSVDSVFSYCTTLRGEVSQSQCHKDVVDTKAGTETKAATYNHRLQQILHVGALVCFRLCSLVDKDYIHVNAVTIVPASGKNLSDTGGQPSASHRNSVDDLLKDITSGESTSSQEDPRQALFTSIARGVLQRGRTKNELEVKQKPEKEAETSRTSRIDAFEAAVLSSLRRQEKEIERLVNAVERIEKFLRLESRGS